MTGIYKITNPNGKIYIGQSVDVNKRFYQYFKLCCKDQPAIFLSLKKHGVENHIFEIIEECLIKSLNNRERFWQEYYNSIEDGLNCKYTNTNDKVGHLSLETKQKISDSQKGKPRIYKSGIHPMLGTKQSMETKLKIQNKRKYIVSEEYKTKVSEFFKGKKLSIAHIEKIRLKNIGKKRTEETKLKQSVLKQNMSDETKHKMSISKLGTKQSLETRMKRSESMKKTLELKKIHKPI